MSEYGQYITHHNTTPLLSHDAIKEKKEARRKLLEEVFKRRAENNRQWYKKPIADIRLIVAHAMRHVTVQKPVEKAGAPAPQPTPMALTPELVETLRVLLAQTTVFEEQPETRQITEKTSATEPEPHTTEEATGATESLFLSVSEEERNKVIAAYTQGIPRWEICSHLRWGSAKYTTIVKPVLDSYLEQEQRAGTE